MSDPNFVEMEKEKVDLRFFFVKSRDDVNPRNLQKDGEMGRK
jgi:hypothetical protein